jgi:hypothetical protein
MTATTAVLMNIAFAAALVGAWAWLMTSARHLRAEQAEIEQIESHVLDLDARRRSQERTKVAA